MYQYRLSNTIILQPRRFTAPLDGVCATVLLLIKIKATKDEHFKVNLELTGKNLALLRDALKRHPEAGSLYVLFKECTTTPAGRDIWDAS